MDRILEKKKWHPRQIATIAAISILPVVFAYLLLFRENKSSIRVDVEKLTLGKVINGNFQEYIPVDGVVQPVTTIYINAVYGGRIDDIYVRDGDMVEKGQPIIRLSNATVENEYMFRENLTLEALNNYHYTRLNIERNRFVLECEMAEMEYEKNLSEANFARKLELFQKGQIAPEDFENAKRDHNIAVRRHDIAYRALQHDSLFTRPHMVQIKESIDRMQQNLRVLSQNLSYLKVVAPVSGQLFSFRAEIGETSQPGENLGRIDALDGLKIKAKIDERYITRTQSGQKAAFTFRGLDYMLEVQKIYSNITGGTFEVDLFFTDDAPEGLQMGQTIQLRLEFSAAENALTIPRAPFFQEAGGNWIYVVDPSGRFAEKRRVRIGRQNVHIYEVLEGLQPGETVIVSSYSNFGARDRLVFY